MTAKKPSLIMISYKNTDKMDDSTTYLSLFYRIFAKTRFIL